MAANTYTRKIGTNRGKPRLWLEGAILTASGFAHGMKWEVITTPATKGHQFHLMALQDGGRKIAGTDARPIIDINSGAILEGFEGCTVTITKLAEGVLLVSKNEEGELS